MTPKTIVITGSSSGFGFRAAKHLADAGHHVWATMRDTMGRNAAASENLRAHASKAAGAIDIVELDVTDETSVNRAIGEIAERADAIDVVVSNAGIWGPGVLEAFTLDQWHHVFDVNVFGTVRLMRAVLPILRGQGHGLVIQISSLQGRFILPYSGPYVASKHAIEGLTEQFRYETAPYGVEVCIIEPYDYMTEMKDKARSNTARDDAVTDSYPRAREVVENVFLTPDPSRSRDPAEVVDAIAKLIDEKPGSRHVRTTVGNPLPPIELINKTSVAMHHLLLPMLQMDHMLKLGSVSGEKTDPGVLGKLAQSVGLR